MRTEPFQSIDDVRRAEGEDLAKKPTHRVSYYRSRLMHDREFELGLGWDDSRDEPEREPNTNTLVEEFLGEKTIAEALLLLGDFLVTRAEASQIHCDDWIEELLDKLEKKVEALKPTVARSHEIRPETKEPEVILDGDGE